jgi:hypothetical protein
MHVARMLHACCNDVAMMLRADLVCGCKPNERKWIGKFSNAGHRARLVTIAIDNKLLRTASAVPLLEKLQILAAE